MNGELRRNLEEELKAQLERINEMETGSEEKAEAINAYESLYKLKIEDDKQALEEEKFLFESTQAESNELLTKLRIGLDVIVGVAPFLLYGACFREGLKFETEGTVTSSMVRNLWSQIKVPFIRR